MTYQYVLRICLLKPIQTQSVIVKQRHVRPNVIVLKFSICGNGILEEKWIHLNKSKMVIRVRLVIINVQTLLNPQNALIL